MQAAEITGECCQTGEHAKKTKHPAGIKQNFPELVLRSWGHVTGKRPAWPFIQQSIQMSGLLLPACLPACPPICLFVRPSFRKSNYPPTHQFKPCSYLPIDPFVCVMYCSLPLADEPVERH